MAFNRFALIALLALGGCGGQVATVKPDPPMDDAKKLEQAVQNLQSGDPVQRGIAVATLGAAGPTAKPHLNELKKLENEGDQNFRRLVKEAIQKIEKGN